MASLFEVVWRGTLAVGIPLIVVLVTTVLPVRGEMCSAIVSVSDDGGIEDLATLQARAFAAFKSTCRKPGLKQSPCMFTTTPSDPPNFKFILGPLSMPFNVHFDVKAKESVIVALADSTTLDSIFARITIGGWSNTRSAIRSCYRSARSCPTQVNYKEDDLLKETEYRPFWVKYDGGVVYVGKGGLDESFLEWNAGAFHSIIHSKVYVGIATDERMSGSWVFHELCE